MKKNWWQAYLLVIVSLFASIDSAAKEIPDERLSPYLHAALVDRFYKQSNRENFWSSHPQAFDSIRSHFLALLDSASIYGLNRDKYHYRQIILKQQNQAPADMIGFDRLFTDAVIAFCKDIYQGGDIKTWIGNDEVSGKYAARDNDFILTKIAGIRSASGLDSFVHSLEPATPYYATIRNELRKQMRLGNTKQTSELTASVNLYRWIHHFQFRQHIVVNIPAATLYYYETDSLMLQMKVVTGKPSTRSPRFSTWCYEVVLYPYWNVPHSIAVKELLPQVKRKPSILESMNMQVLDKNGRIVSPGRINWQSYNAGNFPYSFRQCTGCDNALGVIKFNLTDPFHIYMHDTNYKLAFLRNTWFLSHGCIRLEKPLELANYLLDNKVDSDLVKACIEGLEPMPLKLNENVPVFVVYLPAEAKADSVQFHKDIYRLFR